jgi:hypothetical protein
MNKEFVDYKTALALKELGFDEPCLGHYQQEWHDDGITELEPSLQMIVSKQHQHAYQLCSAPLYQQAFRWLRNQYATCWYIQSEYPAFYGLFIHNGTDYDHTVYDTYEEAEQACLKKLIEICKNK